MLFILGLFGWYFMEQNPFRKKVTASLLTALLVGLCIASFWPPFDARDAQGNILRDDKGNVAQPGKIQPRPRLERAAPPLSGAPLHPARSARHR